MVHKHSAAQVPTPAPHQAQTSVASMVESIVGCKWSVRILESLVHGIHRPSALLRACPGLSAKVMNERLRKMSHFGIIKRTVHGEKPPVEVQYLLTPFGRHFMAILDAVQELQDAVDNGAISTPEEMPQCVTGHREHL